MLTRWYIQNFELPNYLLKYWCPSKLQRVPVDFILSFHPLCYCPPPVDCGTCKGVNIFFFSADWLFSRLLTPRLGPRAVMLLHGFALLSLLALVQLAICAEDYYKVCKCARLFCDTQY